MGQPKVGGGVEASARLTGTVAVAPLLPRSAISRQALVADGVRFGIGLAAAMLPFPTSFALHAGGG